MLQERKIHIIDASGKILGRLASQIAILLRGKHKPTFLTYQDGGDFVVVKNVDKIRLTGKKFKNKKYFHHTGYLGSLKEVPLEKIFSKNPDEILRKAVFGMLPKNKLRAKQIKRLKFK